MANVSITFLTDYEVQDGSGTVHKAGKALKCSEASARHFIVRGVAIPTEEYKARQQAEAKRKAEEEARRKAEEEARRKAEEEGSDADRQKDGDGDNTDSEDS